MKYDLADCPAAELRCCKGAAEVCTSAGVIDTVDTYAKEAVGTKPRFTGAYKDRLGLTRHKSNGIYRQTEGIIHQRRPGLSPILGPV